MHGLVRRILMVAGAAAISGGLVMVSTSLTATSYAATSHPAISMITTAKKIHWGKPIMVENFNGTKLNHRRWFAYNDQTSGPRRVPWAVHVQNGHLVLVGHVSKKLGNISGAVGSTGKYSQTYGRWVIRFRAGVGHGYAAVALLWPQDNVWAEGEMDMAEITDPARRSAGEFMHGPNFNRVARHKMTANFTKWHVLAIDWLPSHITTWLDGHREWTVRRTSGVTNVIPSTPFRLALQNDPGCDGRCHRTKSTPKHVDMYVDWVRIYRRPSSN